MKRFLIALALTAAPLSGAAGQMSIEQPGTIVHGPARAHFPERIGELRRISAHQYDEAGRDVSATYRMDRPGGNFLISIYVYPAPRVSGPRRSAALARATQCQRIFAEAQAAITSRAEFEGTRLVEEGVAPEAEGIDPVLRRHAAYRFTGTLVGTRQELYSQLFLFCHVGGSWLVKYRATGPADFDASQVITSLIRTGPWPGRAAPADPGNIVLRPTAGTDRLR